MRFRASSDRRRPAEAVVPMINVVFLLLIFFLMTASFTPPDPFDLTLAESGVGRDPAEPGTALFVAADGRLAFGAARDAAALEAAGAQDGILDIRADAALPAAELAELLVRLRTLGVSETRLVIRPE